MKAVNVDDVLKIIYKYSKFIFITDSSNYRKMQDEIANLPKVTGDTDEVLDKIRAEIEELPTKTRTNWDGCCPDIDYPEIEYVDVTKAKLLKIIDKYKLHESEEV